MSSYGVCPAGFVPKRLPVIREELATLFREIWGEDTDTGPNSVIGQEVGVLSKPIADIWELAADVYAARSRTGAEGASLDDYVSYRNIKRAGPANSSARVALFADGSGGVNVPNGTTIRSRVTGEEFELLTAVSISSLFVISAVYKVPGTITAGAVYSFELSETDGTNVHTATYTAATGDTPEKVAEVLAASANIDDRFKASAEGVLVTVDIFDEVREFRSGAVVNVTRDKVGTAGDFAAKNPGPIGGAPGTLSEIVTPVSGLRNCRNLWDLSIGRGAETDAELRARLDASRTTATAGTIDAIYEAVRAVPGISFVNVRENATGIAKGGIPANSFAVVFDGQAGLEEAIAAKIWSTKPGGIESAGKISRTVYDKSGNPQTVKMSRPDYLPGHIEIVVTSFNPDAIPPADWKERVARKAVEIASDFPAGYDVPAQALMGAVYSVPGIGTATTRVGKETAPGVIVWASGLLEVLAFERVSFTIERTTVTG